MRKQHFEKIERSQSFRQYIKNHRTMMPTSIKNKRQTKIQDRCRKKYSKMSPKMVKVPPSEAPFEQFKLIFLTQILFTPRGQLSNRLPRRNQLA